MEKLESRIQQNKFHISKLDQMSTLVENDVIDMSRIDGIKEDIDFYVEVIYYLNELIAVVFMYLKLLCLLNYKMIRMKTIKHVHKDNDDLIYIYIHIYTTL